MKTLTQTVFLFLEIERSEMNRPLGFLRLPKADRSCLTLRVSGNYSSDIIVLLDIMAANKEFPTKRAGQTIEGKK